ncbi:MAG: hypothetical protein LBU11_04385 [Zoogloeaceae bacterium]|jgi:hypothetical protein|nr:hypothetical protein [Zoogloeaceae bacterium]
MNTTPPPPFRPSHSTDDNAIDRLLESLKRKEPAPAAPMGEGDLPLLTDIVRAEYPPRIRAFVAQPAVSSTMPPVTPLPEEKLAPPVDKRDAMAAAAALQALETRVQELPHIIANALKNALPSITAEVLREIRRTEDRGQRTENGAAATRPL